MPKQTRLDDNAAIYQPRKEKSEKEKLRELPWSKKFEYMWEYYKVHALIIVAIVGFIYI